MVTVESKKYYHFEVERGQVRSKVTLSLPLVVLYQISLKVSSAEGAVAKLQTQLSHVTIWGLPIGVHFHTYSSHYQ